MSRSIPCLSAAAIALASAAALFAQNPAEKLPVAVVNMQRVAMESAPGKAILDGWKTFEDGIRKNFEVRVTALKAVSQQLAGEKALPAIQKAALQQKKESLESELEAIKGEYQARHRLIETSMEKLQKEAERVLKEYAKERGIAVVITKGGEGREGRDPVIVIDPAADITEELLKRMEKVKIDLGAPEATDDPKPQVLLRTGKGDILIELDRERAPITVANFLRYVESKHYDGTIFHRVIKDFMIQGGGFDEKFTEKPTNEPIKNEARNGLKNVRGTLAMARTNVVNSATSQFFINVVDNAILDHMDAQRFGYAVFGKVVEGMDVVDAIRAVKTADKGMHENVPETTIVIKSAARVKPPAAKDDVKKDEKKEEKKEEKK